MTTRTQPHASTSHRTRSRLRSRGLAVVASAVALLAPVTASAVAAAPAPTLRGTASMQGQVLGRMDPVVGAATVTAFDADTGRAVRSTVADAEGDYRLGGLPAGRYKVRAVKDGWVTGWADCCTATSKATATVFTLREGEVLTQSWNPPSLYLDLWPESVIEGSVRGVDDDPVVGWNGPLGGVKVIVVDEATGATVRSTTTDAQGGYRIGGLMGGDYTVRAVKAGWLSARTLTTTGPWTPAHVDLTMTAEAVLKGQVLGWMDPLGGATVTAFDADTGRAVRSTVADIEGAYRLGGLPAGRYKVRAAKEGWLTGWANYPTGTSKATATVFTLAVGQVLTETWDPPNLSIDLSLASVIDGTVRGVVDDPAGPWEGPLAGVRVTATNTDTGAVSRATTDSLGAYHLGGLATGEYVVRAARTGWLPAREVVSVAPWLSTRVDLTLVAGQVLTQSWNPPNLSIDLWPVRPGS